MRIQVIYDSKFGNTERIARTVADGLGPETRVDAVGDVVAIEAGISLLVVGGPTQAHGTSPAMTDFLGRLPSLDGVAVAAFDTRLTWPRLLSGAASDRIAKALTKRGGHLVAPPESFLVTGGEGPLVEGELDRALAWAKALAKTVADTLAVPV
jgi:flavodoxin